MPSSRSRIRLGHLVWVALLVVAGGAAGIYSWRRECPIRAQPAAIQDRTGRRWRVSDLTPGTRLDGAKLRKPQWQCVRLAGVTLVRRDFQGADLSGADLRGVMLRDTNLRGANLDGANLRGAWFGIGTIWPDGFNPFRAGVLPEDTPL